MDKDFLIDIGVSAIISSIKNPKNRAKLKAVMLKVYTKIKTAYADDPDFD